MSPFSCARESELTALLDRGQWPLAASPELRAHVEQCRSCADLALVKQSVQTARASDVSPALPSAGALWWRAQLRRRNEAIQRIHRLILGAQIFAAVLILVLALTGLIWQLHRGLHPAAWFESLHLDALSPASLPNFEGAWGFVVPLLAALALVSGVVVYFASEKH